MFLFHFVLKYISKKVGLYRSPADWIGYIPKCVAEMIYALQTNKLQKRSIEIDSAQINPDEFLVKGFHDAFQHIV